MVSTRCGEPQARAVALSAHVTALGCAARVSDALALCRRVLAAGDVLHRQPLHGLPDPRRPPPHLLRSSQADLNLRLDCRVIP